MRAVIGYEDGHYYMRAFTGDYTIESYRAPYEWVSRAVDVPETVVAAYLALSIQTGAMQTLLRMLDEQREIPA